MATRPPSADASQQGQQAENYKEYHVKRPGTTPRDGSGAPPRVRAREMARHAIAELRGQLAAVMTLVDNGNGVKLFEAEQTVRQLKVSTRES
jgi:hypothetical protein